VGGRDFAECEAGGKREMWPERSVSGALLEAVECRWTVSEWEEGLESRSRAMRSSNSVSSSLGRLRFFRSRPPKESLADERLSAASCACGLGGLSMGRGAGRSPRRIWILRSASISCMRSSSAASFAAAAASSRLTLAMLSWL
jgi:hypothetical protein